MHLDLIQAKVQRNDMKSNKVLIVDDNDLNRKLFENLIGQIFSFESAKNGLEAVALTAVKDFSLILMDIQMPQMDGITAMKKIRQGNSNCPIIAVTAYAEISDRASFLQQGFDDFITKPIRPKEFLQLIQSYIKGENLEKTQTNSEEIRSEILDKKIVDQLLKYNSKEVIKKVFDDFLAECMEVETQIAKNNSNPFSSELFEKIHNLKGNSGTIGAMRICDSTSKAEEYGRKKASPQFKEELKNLSNEIRQFQEFIKQETIFDL